MSPGVSINVISNTINDMTSITIRNLTEDAKRRLRIRAARNGHSMDQEALQLLEAELARAEAASTASSSGRDSGAGIPPAVARACPELAEGAFRPQRGKR